MSVELHEVAWTPEKVDRLWNFYGSNSAYHNAYFARHSGHRIVAEVAALVGIPGDVLDVGCGPGHLLQHLESIGSWSSYTGVDTSRKSLEEMAHKGGASGRKITGVCVDDTDRLQAAAFNRAFCLEVVEHCDDETLRSILALVHRVLRPDGCMVVTTPNSEDLERSKQVCPDCGCVYHRWQHVRSWTCSGLGSFVRSCGFEVQALFTCNFMQDNLGRDFSARLAAQLRGGRQWRDRFVDLPNIMLVASPVRQPGTAPCAE